MRLRKCWLGFLLAVALRAAPADPWLRIQSAHFELYTTAGEREGRNLARHFEQVRAFFVQAMEQQPDSGKPVRIIAFRNEKEFKPYRPNEVATAFFHDGRLHDYIVMAGSDAEQYQVATHEFIHLLIGQTGGTVPVWLNEGLADLYSTMEQTGSQTLVGRPPRGRAASLLHEPWIDLDVLLAAGTDSPLYNEKSRAGIFYAESWALVHMLNLDAEYRKHLSAMLEALKTGDSVSAFRQAYGKTPAQVERDLQSYAGRQTLQGMTFRIPLSQESEASTTGVHASLYARLSLAELLTDYPGRLDQAKAAYAALAREYPGRWEVESALGSFSWRERRNQEAADHFRRAVDLGAKDATMLDYARTLAVLNRLDEAREQFHAALRAVPGMKDAHFELGLLLVRQNAWRDAMAELQLSRPVNPRQAPRFFYSMAYCEYRLGDGIAARNYLEQGRAYTKIPEEVASLDRLSRSLGPPVVEGILEAVECAGKLSKLHIRVGETSRTFLIPDVKELPCGQQPGVQVRLEFQAMPLGATGADGIARSLEFH